MITKNKFIVQNTAYEKHKALFDNNFEIVKETHSVLDIFDLKGIKVDLDFKGVVQALFTKSFAFFVSIHHL